MKEDKELEIGVNQSSGAEKVETVVEKTHTTEYSPSYEEKKMREEAAARARVEAATQKQQAKAAREERRKAQIERLREEERAELAYLEERKHQKEEAREAHVRERAHAKANRSRERERNKKGNGKGTGGWIAAVVSLGVATLMLTTALVIGAIDMKRTKSGLMSGYKSTTYELMGIMENVDNDLDRVRISASSSQQDRILTDLLVQARLAELDLEKLPVELENDHNVTTFINRVAHECERLLAKLRNGEELSESDMEKLNRMYEMNHSVRKELTEFTEKMTDKDLSDYLAKGKGMIAEAIDKIEKATLMENSDMKGEKRMPREGMETPKTDAGAAIDPAKSEELCRYYFDGYKIKDFQCIGETVSKGYRAYNVQGHDDKGTLLFAEISQTDGKLLRFDYYEECTGENFDLENAETIAENFLEKLGYDDMKAVRARHNGTDTDFTFVYEDDDVIFYPDMIHVKVCKSRGVVTGFDCVKYYKNHKERKEPQVNLTLQEAKSKLHKALQVETSRLTVVQTGRGERTAYEFLCSYGEEKYLVYTDAMTGDEISIVNVKNVG